MERIGLKKIAVTEVLILLIGIIAISWAIGSELESVQAQFPFGQGHSAVTNVASPGGGFKWPKLGQVKEIFEKNLGYAVVVSVAAGYAIHYLSGGNERAQAVGEAGLAGWGAAATVAKAGSWLAPAKGTTWASTNLPFAKSVGGFLKGAAPWIGLAVAIGYLATWKQTKYEVVTFECDAWQAPTGGRNCEKCNQQGIFECTEYQCKSLGQSCELQEGVCVYVNKNDNRYPVLSLNDDALLEKYEYSSKNSKSATIKYLEASDGCAPAFTPLSFGVKTDEPANCRADYERKDTFEEMKFSFGDGKYEHSLALALPSSDALAAESPELKNDGDYELYIRCQDYNGNSNPANFIFKFCIDSGPDYTSPRIEGTSFIGGTNYISKGKSSSPVEVYVNEPANCKWSRGDKEYELMENAMDCETDVMSPNSGGTYTCSSTLTGLEDRKENKFYFRCQDVSENKNTNEESYEFVLTGTEDLVLSSVGPEGKIKGSRDYVKVTLEAETSAGAEDGKAVCYYSETGNEGTYYNFFSTNSHKHSQDLYLTSGNYEMFIKCIDIGGNDKIQSVNFEVESDPDSPKVVRAYKEGTSLKLITNKESECVYDIVDCSYAFDSGLDIVSTDGISHFLTWDAGKTYYIKCKDDADNQPSPSECSMIVRAVDY